MRRTLTDEDRAARRWRGSAAWSVAFAMAYLQAAWVADRHGRLLRSSTADLRPDTRWALAAAEFSLTIPGLAAWAGALALVLLVATNLRLPNPVKTFSAVMAFALFTAWLSYTVHGPLGRN